MEPEWCVPIFLFLYIPVSSISFEYNFSQGFAIIKWPTKWHLYDGMVVSANARWSSFHNVSVYPIKTLHILHLHNVLCQLYLKAAGARRKGSGKKPRDPTAFRVVCSLSRVRLWPHELVPFNTPGESSQPRAGTWLSCIGRRILYHCATWETHIHLHILKMIAVTLVLPCKTPPLNNSFLRVWKILIF